MKLNLYKAAARIFMAALFVCLLMPGAQAREKYKATFIYIPLDDRPVTYTYPVANIWLPPTATVTRIKSGNG